MNDDRYLRLQIQATKTIINFCQGNILSKELSKIIDIIEEEEENKIVTPFADGLLSAMVKLFQKGLSLGPELNANLILEDVRFLKCAFLIYRF